MQQNLTSPVVSAKGLGRRFGRTWAVSHFNLEIGAGEVVLLAGANGSGKTTLLRVLAGLHRPTAGTLTVCGHPVPGHHPRLHRQVSLISHPTYLYDRLTALETLRLWCALLGVKIERDQLLEWLQLVRLVDHRDEKVGGFSTGMRKRLSLLRIPLERPQLLLLDEPLAALDIEGQELVRSWVRKRKSQGVAVILAAHNLERVADLCDRALLLRAGQLAWQGAASEASMAMERGS